MHLKTSAVLVVLLGATGCSQGKISLEKLDRFGAVRSAVWFEWEQEYLYDQGDDTWHNFVMTTAPGLCSTVQEIMPELGDRYEAYIAEAFGGPDVTDTTDTGNERRAGGGNASCDAYEDLLRDFADLTEPMYREGDENYLTMTFRDPDDDRDETPEDGDYDAGIDPDDNWFTGILTYWEQNPYEALANAVDCDAGDYGDLYETLHDAGETYWVDDGEAELSEKNTDKLRIEVDADLVDDDDDDEGDITAEATFKHCKVEWEGSIYLSFF